MICYDLKGPYCKYCYPMNNPTGELYGMPRYQCIHPVEKDEIIDADEICDCPESYVRKSRQK